MEEDCTGIPPRRLKRRKKREERHLEGEDQVRTLQVLQRTAAKPPKRANLSRALAPLK